MTPEFKPFAKMPRLSRECIITEKIDGTNASIYITEIAEERAGEAITGSEVAIVGRLAIYAGSRTRWITPENDNYGFAKWVRDNAEQLALLGPGHHFGEWWGSGIQRGYGLTKGEKRFSLFNAQRWAPQGFTPLISPVTATEKPPECCCTVPVIYIGDFDTTNVEIGLKLLKQCGSIASPGFMKPEGVVVYHVAGNLGFKKTIEKDDQPKGQA